MRKSDIGMIERVFDKERKGLTLIDAITEIMNEDECDAEDITEKLPSEMLNRVKLEFAKRRYRSALALFPDIDSNKIDGLMS